jgi:glycosyltransferase involved in cell wall biosynthesis
MKVLHIFNEIKYSGAEMMYLNAVPIFKEKDITLIALGTGEIVGDFAPQFGAIGIEIIHLPLPNNCFSLGFLFKYFYSFYQIVKNKNIDVIHIHRSTYYLFFSFVGFLTNKRTIRTVHNVFKHRKITWIKGMMERLISRKVFGLIFQTIGDSVYENELHYYKNPSIKINNWYNSNKFYKTNDFDEKRRLREKFNIPLDSFVIISTGGCNHTKNHHDIIKALNLVISKFKCTYLHLGSGPTECEEATLANSLEIANSIVFLGNVNNVREYLIAADVYVMTSRFEGLSIAAIEAMACGLPSILYNAPGLRDLIHEDDNGFLINQDFNEVANKIIAYRENRTLISDKSKKAKQYVEENFVMHAGVNKIIDLYNS